MLGTQQPRPLVRIGVNPHWYSKFWIRQFYQLWRQDDIVLRPLLTRRNPPYCFEFEVDGSPYFIDISDHKTLAHDPADYLLYFKANYGSDQQYPANVVASLNGSTLTRWNIPPTREYDFDIVWIAGISGGRPHKVALFEALAALPLKMKLAAKMVGDDDLRRWAPRLRAAGVEVWTHNIPYKKWLEGNKQARWCVLARGKHDCLSFRMIDYMSIGAAVVADYAPTTQWPVPLEAGRNYLNLNLSGPQGNDLSESEFDALRAEYQQKVKALLPLLRDENQRQRIATTNGAYFQKYIVNGQAARDVLKVINKKVSSSSKVFSL